MRKLLNEELLRLTPEEFRRAPKTPLVFVLDNVRSHLNVGSIFRTADAFLLEAVYLCGITGIPPHREIHKTALGATETVAWRYYERTEDAIAELRRAKFEIASAEQAEGAIPLQEFQPKERKRYAVLLGNEVDGVAQDLVTNSDLVLEIPQLGTKHSLNIAVSAGIVAWHFLIHSQPR